jgi:predicted amidophosphoribosyltransferase
LGALLVPGIKEGEQGWKSALLRRAAATELPPWTEHAELVTCAPTALHRRWMRGFDLAEDAAKLLAARLAIPFAPTLKKNPFRGRQAERTESERRNLPRKAIILRRKAPVEGRIILLVDDVWTTGTTLLRCAQALAAGGAREINVLTLFRAL